MPRNAHLAKERNRKLTEKKEAKKDEGKEKMPNAPGAEGQATAEAEKEKEDAVS